MFVEKPMIEAVEACFDNAAVYVLTKGDDVLFPMEIFKMEELRDGSRLGWRCVVDMPELPEGTGRRTGEGNPAEDAGERKKALGREVFELREQGLSYKEIAARLGKNKGTLASALSAWKKKQERAAEGTGAAGKKHREKQDEYVPELAERTSVVTGKPVEVDVKKARALRKAGWSMEETADEFNISVKDMEELLDKRKKEKPQNANTAN